LSNYLYVAVGAALGGVFRYWISGAVHKYLIIIFPLGTFAANFIGSLLLGFIIYYLDAKQIVSSEFKIFLTIGFCGGLTTFSTFSFETFALLQQNEIFHAFLNVLLNVFLTISAIFLAYYLSKSISVV
jgi:fluoride exporter